MPITMGENIKIILGRRNMTLAQLAEKTGQITELKNCFWNAASRPRSAAN